MDIMIVLDSDADDVKKLRSLTAKIGIKRLFNQMDSLFYVSIYCSFYQNRI
ncbi:MAG: hypothetical protein NC321_10375 [Clostridium sp.]|nr:hypothetical protein [Clostridium sp.]